MGPDFVQKRNEEVALILVQAKLLTQAAAADLVRTSGPEYLEETILLQKTISEAELVKALAGAFRTQFLSTEKLAKAEIPQATLSTNRWQATSKPPPLTKPRAISFSRARNSPLAIPSRCCTPGG